MNTAAILAAIDVGLQEAGDVSYGEHTGGPYRCWRCRVNATDHKELMCGACREWMQGDSDDDPAGSVRVMPRLSHLFAGVNQATGGEP